MRRATGELTARQSDAYRQLRGDEGAELTARQLDGEQSNSSTVFGDRLILKLYRRVEIGTNPDLEINLHLSQRGFAHVPPTAGSLEFRSPGQPAWPLGILAKYMPTARNAWELVCTQLEEFLRSGGDVQIPRGTLLDLAQQPIPSAVAQTLRPFLTAAEVLGCRTAELHLALAAGSDQASFAPEMVSPGYLAQLSARSRALVRDTFGVLRGAASQLPSGTRILAETVLSLEATIDTHFAQLAILRPEGLVRIRCHGDYHLGQVLSVADDYTIIDFEGEPARPLEERRERKLALVDVAGMIRSYDYASCTAREAALRTCPPDAAQRVKHTSRAWHLWTAAAFLGAYRRTVGPAPFIPQNDHEFKALLETCLLTKAVYELQYELNNRPDWAWIPLSAIANWTP